MAASVKAGGVYSPKAGVFVKQNGAYVGPNAALNPIAFSHRLSTPNVPTPNASNLRFFGQRTRIGNRTDQLLNNLVFEFQNDIANSAILVNAPQLVLEVGISINSNADNPSRSLLTFEGGGTSVTLSPGQVIKTVPRVLGSPLAFGEYVDLFMDLQYATAPSALPATNVVSFNYPADSNEASATTRVNKALTGGITTRSVARNVFGPTAAYAIPAAAPSTPRVVGLGDSIVTSANDTTSGAYIAFMQRALGANYPWTVLSQAGYSWGLMTGANLAKTYACIEGGGAFTHALAALGTNDFAGGTGATAETIYALMVEHKAYLDAKGIKLIVCTPWPRTNASNNAIPSGDNAAVWTRIQTLRNLIIANNGVGYGYFDLSLYARDATDVNLWRTDLGSPTSDGIHPNTVIHTAVSTALAAALPALLV